MSSPPYSTSRIPAYLDFSAFGAQHYAAEQRRAQMQAEADLFRATVSRRAQTWQSSRSSEEAARRSSTSRISAARRSDFSKGETWDSCSCTTSTAESARTAWTCSACDSSLTATLGTKSASCVTTSTAASCSTCPESCTCASAATTAASVPQARWNGPRSRSSHPTYGPPSYHTFARPVSVRSSDIGPLLPPASICGSPFADSSMPATRSTEPTLLRYEYMDSGIYHSPCHSITQPSSPSAVVSSINHHSAGEPVPDQPVALAQVLRARLTQLKLDAVVVAASRQRAKDAIRECKEMHEQYTAKKADLRAEIERVEREAYRRKEERDLRRRKEGAESDWRREEEGRVRAAWMAEKRFDRDMSRRCPGADQ